MRYASPQIALAGLKSALEEGDALELDERVDFPHLRQSLKDQFNAVMLESVSGTDADNPFEALALGFAAKLIDGIVDSLVTPAGLAKMSKGDRPMPGSDRDPATEGDAAASSEKHPFENARISRDSLSRFSASVSSDDEDEIQFVFRRTGPSWRLTGIPLPTETPAEAP